MADEFKGRIGPTITESKPWWPDLPQPRDGAPNVVVILFDDTGFSHFGCYGSTIDTPNIDRLARGGLRYTNFHTTALCSPTRAALLTGRNHHSVGMRGLSNWNTGFPNCTGTITKSAATLAEQLRPSGYSTFAVGKWHLTPMEETSAAGPYDQWPLGRGFDRYYGFIQGETDQFIPELYYDNHPVDPPKTPEQGYHLSEDLIDRGIGFIRDQKSAIPERPFFLYLCFGATHAPHQAPKQYLDKYKGRFDAGWDKVRQDWFERQKKLGIIPADTELAPRNPGVEPWDSLSDNQKKLALRLQEAFAGFLDHTDAQIGRLIDFLSSIGELDNTALFLMSDNGASQEGGPNGIINSMQYFNGLNPSVDESMKQLDEIGGPHAHNNYPWGWAQVGNCPGKRYKQNTHGGGIRDPLIVHWPQGVRDPGSIRHQFHHVTDITPTVLEIVGVEPASTMNGIPQMPIHGKSLAYTFAEEGRTAPTTKQVQYFEMFGHRGIWANGWKAVAFHNAGQPFESDEWELYHLDKDFSECKNLAKSHPEKLREMVDLWWIEAGKNGVLPLDDRRQELWRPTPRKRTPRNRRRYVILPPVGHINSDVAPAIGNRTFKITAEIDRPTATSQGCLVSYGASTNGLALYILGDRVVFDYNLFRSHFKAVSDRPVPTGASSVGVAFERLGKNGRASVLINGEACGTVEIPFVLRMISTLGMDIGRDAGAAVSTDYVAPFAFEGSIKRITFDLPDRGPEAERQAERAQIRADMARQ
jgi:arylsulfatase